LALSHQPYSSIECSARDQLSAAPQRGISQLRIKVLQGQADDHLVPREPAVNSVRIFAGFDYELVESRTAAEKNFAVLRELRRGIRSFREILFCQFLEADFSVERHEDVNHQRHECLIRADVGRSLLAPD